MRVRLVLALIIVVAATVSSNPNVQAASRAEAMTAAQIAADLVAPGTSSQIEESITGLEGTLARLYSLCHSDAVCSDRFFLADSAVTEPVGNDLTRRLQASSDDVERTKFARLAVHWAMRDDCPLAANAVRDRITISEYNDADAAWWLTIMRTARFCGDNQIWVLRQGCVAKRDRIGTSDAQQARVEAAKKSGKTKLHNDVDEDGGNCGGTTSKSTADKLAAVTVTIAVIVIVGAIIGVLYIVKREFTATRKHIDTVMELRAGKAPRHTMGTDLIQGSVDGAGAHSGGHMEAHLLAGHSRHG